MSTFALVHNIPSPYRLYLFEVLGVALRARGVQLHVHFMSRGHRDRPHWSFAGDELPFEHTFWTDRGTEIRGKEWHLNPGLVGRLRRQEPDYLMVGGPWDSLTGMTLTAAVRAGRRIAWIEGNTHTPGLVSGLPRLAKSWMLGRYDLIAVPGREGRAFVHLLRPRRCPPTVLLPNVIDEGRFRDVPSQIDRDRIRSELDVAPGERLAIWNARLIPAKNVVPFLRAIERRDLDGWRLVILGQGPQVHEVDQLCATLAPAVRRIDYVAYERMPAIYHAADLFLLPSLHDPNPLSIVEALHAGLPLLVSSRIGNHPEAIEEGENGWTVDPLHPVSMKEGLRRATGTSAAVLRRMGERSRRIAAERWTSRLVIERFLDEVMAKTHAPRD